MGEFRVIAIRIKGKGNKLVVESLGQSPRGTRFIIGTKRINTSGLSKGDLKHQVEQAALELIPTTLPFE